MTDLQPLIPGGPWFHCRGLILNAVFTQEGSKAPSWQIYSGSFYFLAACVPYQKHMLCRALLIVVPSSGLKCFTQVIACCSQRVSDDLPSDQISILFSYSSQYNACYLVQMIYSKMPVMATVKRWKMIALLCCFISGHGSGCLPAL